MILFLLRHGDASQEAFSDRQRPLSEEGKISILRVAKYLTDENIRVTKIITSPLLRAWQTALIIGDNFKISEGIQESEYLLPESNPADIISELKSFRDDEKVLLVSHQSFLGILISQLICKGFANIEVRKASLACVETEQPVSSGKGVLRFLLNLENIN
jgi:phosphohistidine phosphatase